MKKHGKYLLLLLFAQVIWFFQCSGLRKNKQVEEFPKTFAFLIGERRLVDENGVYHESWKKLNDKEFIGRGTYLAKNGDTVYKQVLRLGIMRKDVVLFIDKIRDSSHHFVEYRLLKANGNAFFFENTFNEYPNLIQLSKLNKGDYRMEFFGSRYGQSKTEEFTLTSR